MNSIGIVLAIVFSIYYSYKSFLYLKQYLALLKHGVKEDAVVIRKEPITFRNYVPVVKINSNGLETRTQWFDLILTPLIIGSEVQVMFSSYDVKQLPIIRSSLHIVNIILLLLFFYGGIIFFALRIISQN